MTTVPDGAAPADVPPEHAGKPKPSPIQVTNLVEQDYGNNSSPLGAALMQRKVERQNCKDVQGTGLRPENPIAPDSPGWEMRVSMMRQDAGAANNSSPVGSALLARKMERQHQQLDRELARPAGGPASGADELLPPPPLQTQPR